MRQLTIISADGKTYELDLPPEVSSITLDMGAGQGVKVSRVEDDEAPIPEGAHEETINGVRCLVYDDTKGCKSVCCAVPGKGCNTFYWSTKEHVSEELCYHIPESTCAGTTDAPALEWARHVVGEIKK